MKVCILVVGHNKWSTPLAFQPRFFFHSMTNECVVDLLPRLLENTSVAYSSVSDYRPLEIIQ